MEVLYSVTVTFIVGIIFSILFSALKSTTKSHKKLPPGPMKLPIIGNLHNMIGTLPHHTLRRLSQKYGPLMHLKLGESPMLVVSSADMAAEFMRTNDLSFAQRPRLLALDVTMGSFYGNISFSPYGDYWRQMRKLCVLELLSNKRVQSFSPIREVEVQRLIQSIRSSPGLPINLSERFLGLMGSIISRSVFGRKFDSKEAATLSKIKETIVLIGGFELADLFPSIKILQVLSRSLAKLRILSKDIDGSLQNIIDKHVSEARKDDGEIEDLVDVLLRAQNSGDLDVPLTNKSIRAIMGDMFVGGTETTATTVEWAMAEMMKHPNVMAKAQVEIRETLQGKKLIKEADIQGLDYLKLVIKETLRLHPPVPLLLPRECREHCVVKGYSIPMKTKVIINAWAIGRDPKNWDDAETFYPERFVNSFIDFKGNHFDLIPFGAGRRICPGINFGMATVELTLAQLLYHFNWILPDKMKPEDLDMTERFGAGVGRKFDLRLVPVPFLPYEE